MDEMDEFVEPMEEDEADADENPEPSGVYLPGTKLDEGEGELECDESAYVMLHAASTGAPCLSFDLISEGSQAVTSDLEFPLTTYMVAGTQAAKTHTNNLIVMRMSNLHKTSSKAEDEDSDLDSDEDEGGEDEERKPQMSCALIKHQGAINRVRTTNLRNSVFAATWSELGRVSIYDLKDQLQAVEGKTQLSEYERRADTVKPVHSFSGHQKEGFAMDWSSAMKGYLATGDCRRDIHVWKPSESGWAVDQHPLLGHQDSVEDLQWSPNEANVLASCSVDRSIRIWDIRAPASKACMLTAAAAHQSDVNVISWNRHEPLIVSGGDDGVINIWDLRHFQAATPIATFKHHKDHVTTVEWHPTDSTVFASGGDDDQIVLWDVAVEKDEGIEEQVEENLKDLPPQLLFIHQGQKEIKELHWHPTLSGVIFSTSHSGFNVFKTISV